MIGFTLHKAFFDFWDNLISILVLNLGFTLLAGIPIFLPHWLYALHPAASFAALILGVLLLFLYAGGVSLMCRDMSDYRRPGFAEFFAYLKEGAFSSLILGLIMLGLLGLLAVAFPVYGAMNNLLGLTALVFLFWTALLWLLAAQYYFPLRARLDRQIGKLIRKSFLLLFDNGGFTLFLALGAVGIVVLSSFTAFLLPGPAGLLLWFQVGFKLRLLKYDYREEHPEDVKSPIPWNSLLEAEREKVGPRSLKGMIFPWRE